MAAMSEQVLLQNLNSDLASKDNRSRANRLLPPVDETVRRKGIEILENDCRHLNEVRNCLLIAPKLLLQTTSDSAK